jgi:HEAT repeat protein/TolA-binding protein
MSFRTFTLVMLVASPLAAQSNPKPVAPAAPVAPTPAAKPAPAPRPAPAAKAFSPSYGGMADDILAEARSYAASRIDEAQIERQVEAAARAMAASDRVMEAQSRAMASAQRAIERSELDIKYGLSFAQNYDMNFSSGGKQVPQGWAKSDPADSLWRLAREQLNRGDYRRAAAMFKEIPNRYSTSTYAADALYWQAYALYRIGGTSELQEGLASLETKKTKYPGARSQPDEAGLAARIASVLSQRGMANDAAVRRALTAGGNECDREDQQVRLEALRALKQADAEAARTLTTKILNKKDECSANLRQNAIYMLMEKPDAAVVGTLVNVAKNDPSNEVRSTAVNFLGQQNNDQALGALEELSRASENEQVQRAAVRALASSPNVKARTAMRSIIEKGEASENLRMAALDAFDRERSTAEDAAWLRGVYGKVDNPRVKARIANAIARIGGDANDQWLAALVKNEDESIESRMTALRRISQTMEISALSKMYDASSQRQIRETIISTLGDRKEAEATDKLIEIAKGGTDYRIRQYAISALTRKKDPRTTKLLMEIIDK